MSVERHRAQPIRRDGTASLLVKQLLPIVTKLLIVFAAPLVSADERFFDFGAWMPALDIFQRGIHCTGNLVEFHAARFGVHGSFKAETEKLFVLGKVALDFG